METAIEQTVIFVLDSTPKRKWEDIMDVIEAIRTRRSIRAFKPDPVPKKVLQELLDVSRWAPSGGNVQPWYFEVLSGQSLAKVTSQLVQKAKTWDGRGYVDTKPDLPRTGPYPKLLAPRRQQLQTLLNPIYYPRGTKDLETKQLERREDMLRFFDAPAVVMICTDDRGPTSMVSIGTVVQTICLAALAYGLGTCIMGIPVLWPEIFRELLNIPKDRAIVTSIAVGYPDLGAPINAFPRPREPLDNLVEWYGL
jgi:nitroreductase